jgi:hypothetical protein
MSRRRRASKVRSLLRRKNLQRAAIVLSLLVIAGAILLFTNSYNSSSPNPPPVAGVDGTDTPPVDSLTTGASPTGTAAPGSILSKFPASLTSKLGKNFRGMPGHTVVLSVSSSGSILRVGYLVPSADNNQVGDMHDVNGGWSGSFVARGPEGPYSAIFIQANNSGTPVHCTVTVDGVQKDSETISGKKKQGLCYG